MTDRKLLEQALEFVTSERWGTTPYMDVCVYGDAARLRYALRAALAKPEPRNQCGETCERAKLCAVCLAEMGEQGSKPEQDPVAYVCLSNPKNADGTLADIRMWLSDKPEGYGHELLTIPQSKREWQWLTDEEISAISKSIPGETDLWAAKFFFARAIEAKLRGKND
jgi:hypothetical protein